MDRPQKVGPLRPDTLRSRATRRLKKAAAGVLSLGPERIQTHVRDLVRKPPGVFAREHHPRWKRALRYTLERLGEPTSWGALGLLTALGLSATGAGLVVAVLPAVAGLAGQFLRVEGRKRKEYATHIAVPSGNSPLSTTTNQKKSKTMEEEKGIKETTDVLVAGGGVTISIVKAVKDGKVTVEEVIGAVQGNLEELIEAARNAEQIPGELADVDVDEGFQLIDVVQAQGRSVVDAIRG